MSDERVGPSAGAMLRSARERKGTSIAALAASLKVAPAKLEALEAGRHDALPDPAFARALALALCRNLQLDPAPVLAGLPRPSGEQRLERVAQGLRTPFAERPGRLVPDDWWRAGTSPLVWLAVLVLLAAGAVYFVPATWIAYAPALARVAAGDAPSVADAPVHVTEAPSVVGIEPAASSGVALSPSLPQAVSASAVLDAPTAISYSVPLDTSAEAASGALSTGASLQIRTRAESWVEVADAQGRPLLSRLVAPGESVGLEGALPLKVRIGNAAATDVRFRGEPVELAAHTRDNVARFELE